MFLQFTECGKCTMRPIFILSGDSSRRQYSNRQNGTYMSLSIHVCRHIKLFIILEIYIAFSRQKKYL